MHPFRPVLPPLHHLSSRLYRNLLLRFESPEIKLRRFQLPLLEWKRLLQGLKLLIQVCELRLTFLHEGNGCV